MTGKDANSARSSYLLIASSLITLISQLVKSKLAAAVLGPAGYGVVNQAKQFNNLQETSVGLGLSNGLLKYVSLSHANEDPDETLSHITSTLLPVGILASIAVFLVLIFRHGISEWVYPGSPAYTHLIIIVACTFPAATLARITKAVLTGCRLHRSIATHQMVAELIGVVCSIWWILQFGITGAVAAFAVFHWARYLLLTTALVRERHWSWIAPDLSRFQWKKLLEQARFGIAALLVGPMGSLAVLSINRQLYNLHGEVAVGLFLAVWTISSLFQKVFNELQSVDLSSTFSEGDPSTFPSQIVAATRFVVGLGVPGLLVLGALGAFVVQTLFSAKFHPVGDMLLIALPGDLFRLVFETILVGLFFQKRLVGFVFMNVLRYGLFLGIAYPAVEHYGVPGAVYAYSIANSVVIITCLVLLGFLIPTSSSARIIIRLLCSTLWVIAASAIFMNFDQLLIRIPVAAVACLSWYVVHNMQT